MADTIHIQTALISVWDKSPLEALLPPLAAAGVRFVSTGGTRKHIIEAGYNCDAVEELTGYPSILGGRVKTLHPKIFGGILARRDNPDDQAQTEQFDIPPIDLVVVDLYPFEATVASGAPEDEIIEKIDIGGISLIRAAAKNYHDVTIVASQRQVDQFLQAIQRNGAVATTLEQRRALATEAFAVTSAYDSHIFAHFDGGNNTALRIAADNPMTLRYGENPHQTGQFYGDFSARFTQLHGKEVSYNNLLDIDAATALINDCPDKPTFVILKHNNACGLAVRPTLAEAFRDALAGDPVSAFGGIHVANREIDAETARLMNEVFIEVCIAPGYTPEALDILKQKKNRVILVAHPAPQAETIVRSALGGLLVQQRDNHVELPEQWTSVTEQVVDNQQADDLMLANIIVKHSKSNAITLVKNCQLLASGVGQTSRVDALEQAIGKARHFKHDLNGAVMASDAFFPFPDCVEIAHQAGITAVIHPGGSVRDQESIDYCNAHNMAMVTTGFRHFRH